MKNVYPCMNMCVCVFSLSFLRAICEYVCIDEYISRWVPGWVGGCSLSLSPYIFLPICCKSNIVLISIYL